MMKWWILWKIRRILDENLAEAGAKNNNILKTLFWEKFNWKIEKNRWNHDEMTDFSEILGKILKFLWNHAEMTDFNEISSEI